MTERVISVSGKTVIVAAPGEGGGTPDIPNATTEVFGLVRLGGNLEIADDGSLTVCPATKDGEGVVCAKLSGIITVNEDGELTIPFATPSQYGVVKPGSNINITDGVMRIPTANRATAGVVKTGETMMFAPDGTMNVMEATTDRIGGLKQSMPVPDMETIAVVDIESAQAAIAALGTTLSQLLQSMRNSGQLENSDTRDNSD